MATRILVSRTDRIGDVVLTLPLCGLLKAHLDAEILFLGRAYTRPVADASPFVDGCYDWDAVAEAPPHRQRDFLRDLRANHILHVFPRRDIARAARAAGIPRRTGTNRRLYNWFYCNELEPVARRGSDLHEAQLNVQLARRLLPRADWSLAELASYGRIQPRVPVPPDVSTFIDPQRVNVALHPKSQGHGREWPLEHWRALVDALDASRFRLFVTGSRDEGELLRGWLATLPPHVVDLTGRLTLGELVGFLASVDGAVAAGTGPLHLAAAAGVNALGLFPPTRPIHAGRWGPVGPRASVLTASQACAACRSGRGACDCMRAISVEAVAERIGAWAQTDRRPASRGSPASR
jgi:heptosyltransferase-3